MLDGTLLIKIIGASIGSSIAVVFKPGGDSYLQLLKRFLIGLIVGVISSPILLDHFGWEHRFDYWLAASAFAGLVSIIILQILFSEVTASTIKNYIPGGKK